MALVSVVVATVADVDLTRQCLSSLRAQTYEPLEIIVVCNGSPAAVRDALAGEFSDFAYVVTDSNLGFAGGYNAGLRVAHGPFIAIINNDAVASRDWIAALVDTAGRDESVGAVASIVLDGDREGVVDSGGLGIARDGMSRQRGRGMPRQGLRAAVPVLMPSGCACLFRRDALAVSGLFDEDFFAYCEDADLGLRLRWCGYHVLLAPGSEVVHTSSMTAGPFSLRKVFWVERNHLWLVVKDFPLPLLVLAPFVTLWRFVLQAYAMWSGTGELQRFGEGGSKVRLAFTVVRAWSSFAAGLPRMLRKRRDIHGRARVGTWSMCRTIWSFRLSLSEVLLGGHDAGQ